jgi:hypothetical protein
VTRPDDGFDPDFRRYLAAKETVDDRALHRPTLDALTEALAGRAAGRDGPVRLLEVGAGLGPTLRRLLAWERLPARVSYLGVEARPALAAAAADRTVDWARDAGYEAHTGDADDADPPGAEGEARGGVRRAAVDAAEGAHDLLLRRGGERVRATFLAGDAFAVADAARAAGGRFDCAVAAAFLDVVETRAALDALVGVVPDGWLYAPVTFDGVTAFLPEGPRGAAVVDRYHATMDAADRPGGSRTGRALFEAVPAAGGRVVAAGGSDWTVHPPYPADEAYFLRFLVHTVESAVGDALSGDAAPDADAGAGGRRDGAGTLDPAALAAWAADRHAAVADGELAYLAHNLDVLARVE